MIPVAELDRIAGARLEDAKALLQAGRYDGATYICGYAVEAALKARICRILNWADFPRTGAEFQSYRSFQTHDLDVLLRLSGRELEIKKRHFAEWNIVAFWKSESRYNNIGTAQAAQAHRMITAAEVLLQVL